MTLFKTWKRQLGISTENCCDVEGCSKPIDYHKNPYNGRMEAERGWCRECYERLFMRSARDGMSVEPHHESRENIRGNWRASK